MLSVMVRPVAPMPGIISGPLTECVGAKVAAKSTLDRALMFQVNPPEKWLVTTPGARMFRVTSCGWTGSPLYS